MKILQYVSPRVLVVLSMAFLLYCLERQELRHRQVRMKQVAAQPIPTTLPEHGAVMNVDQVQAFVVALQLCPAGTIKSVVLDATRVGASPMLTVVVVQDDGSIIRTCVILDGLQVERVHDGVVWMRKDIRHQDAILF